MPNLSEIIGKPVRVADSGVELGKVIDVVMDNQATTVLAFLLREASLIRFAQVVPFARVVEFTPDHLEVASEAAVTITQYDSYIHEALISGGSFKGKQVHVEGQGRAGVATDLAFDLATGGITWITATPSGVEAATSEPEVVVPTQGPAVVSDTMVTTSTSAPDSPPTAPQSSPIQPPAAPTLSAGESLESKRRIAQEQMAALKKQG